MAHWSINYAFSNLSEGFRKVTADLASPRRKVAVIEKRFSNGATPWPVAWLRLECGHSAAAVIISRDRSEHDDANHIVKADDVVGCSECRRYLEQLDKLKALKPGDVRHSRFRTRDSRGIGAGDYYVYRPEPKSPTGCELLMSIEATAEAGEILRRLSASPLSPTEPR